MEFVWFIVGVLVSIYSYYWYRRPKKFPPGPRGIPILGVMPYLGTRPGETIAEWSKTYGPIMSVRMATEDQIFLNSYDVIIQAFAKKGRNFSGRPHNDIIYQTNKGNGIPFVDCEEKWKSQRKFWLTTFRGTGAGKQSMESKIIQEVDCLNKCIYSNNGKPFDISFLLKNAILNNICNVLMGKRFEYDDDRFQTISQKLMRRYSDPVHTVFVMILMVQPKLRYIPPFSYYNKIFVDDHAIVHSEVEDIVKEHEDSFDGEKIRDFIDAFIKEREKGKDPHFTDEQLLHYTHDLLSVGTETTLNILCWCMLCCLHYPQAQTKIRNEIMEVIGPDGTFSMTKKSEMPYTNAFIQEVYRFPSLGELTLPHKTTEDTELGGYIIPKGTPVFANLKAINNNPELFEKPNEFKPERFLDEKGNYLPSNHVIPFSVGPRNCLGEQLARMEIFMMLVGMLQKFEFSPDPQAEELPDLESHYGLLHTPPNYKVVAHKV